MVGGAVVDVFGFALFVGVVHFEFGDEGVKTEVGEGDIAFVHAAVEGVDGGGLVAGIFEVGGDAGGFAGGGDEGGVGDGVDPVVGEASEDFEFDIGGAATVI